jgi:hypothetical protein
MGVLYADNGSHAHLRWVFAIRIKRSLKARQEDQKVGKADLVPGPET